MHTVEIETEMMGAVLAAHRLCDHCHHAIVFARRGAWYIPLNPELVRTGWRYELHLDELGQLVAITTGSAGMRRHYCGRRTVAPVQ